MLPCLSIEIDPIHYAHDDGLHGNRRVLEQRSRRVAFLHHENLLAHADADDIERNDLGAFLLIVEIESTNEQKFFLSEMLMAVRGHDVTDDASEVHAALPGLRVFTTTDRVGVVFGCVKNLLPADVHPVHLPDNARVNGCERIVERQRGLA